MVLLVFVQVLCFLSVLIHVASHVYLYITYVCVPIGNTCLGLLQAGPGEMALPQPHLSQATGFGNPDRYRYSCY